jgi:hypothetical protein
VSFAFAWPLQQALFAALRAHPDIAAMAGGRVHDEPPHGAEGALADGPIVILGDESVEPWGTATDAGAAHAVQIAVVSAERGFGPLKRLAGAVCDVALGPLSLSRGRVVNQSFLGGRTSRAEGGLRRIDLRFRIAVEDV